MADATCVVKFADGTRCIHPAKLANGWCRTCYAWSRRNGGKDPNGRACQRKGAVLPTLRAAASATTDKCIMLRRRRGRPYVTFAGKDIPAARAVWWIRNGNPGKWHVLHRCHQGDEGCINIRHLYLGDNARNCQDKVDAGRQPRGEAHVHHRLTEGQVREIRDSYIPGVVSHSILAKRYGISPTHVSGILSRNRWKHVE